MLWLLGGIFTPHLSNMPDTLATIAEALPATAASATVVRTAWTPCRAAREFHVAPSVVVAHEQTPDVSSRRRGRLHAIRREVVGLLVADASL